MVPPRFENFSLDELNREQKPFVKKRLTEPVKNRSTDWSTGVDFEIYQLGQFKKILTGSISEIKNKNDSWMKSPNMRVNLKEVN